VYYSERFDNRLWSDSEDCFCVDAGLAYPMSFPNATLTAASANGTNNITSTILAFGGTGYTNPTATAVDSTGQGTGVTFTVTTFGGVITGVIPVLTGENYTAGATEIIISDPTGTDAVVYPVITNYVTFTASSAVFTSGMVGDVIRMGNGKATIVGYTSTTQVLANITSPITAVVNNDPNFTPIPAISGTWSISTPTTTVSGLNHLEGLTVTGLADGGVIVPQVVTNGAITLQQPASAITVGLPFTAQLQCLRLETPSQTGTGQTKRKNIPSVGIRVHESRGFSAGINQPDSSTQPGNVNLPWANLVEVKERNQSAPMGSPIPLFSGDYFVNIPSEWDERGQVAVQTTNPLPLNLDCLVFYYNEGDTSGG
jgi:hypothetical protein